MLISVTSIATMLVSAWMTMMYFVLRHPGYQWRAAMAATICLGAATLVTGKPLAALRVPVVMWGAAILALGVWGLAAPGDDGWALVAAVLFVVEGTLAIAAVYGSRPRTPTASL
jgi:hypothetical protein